MTSPNLPHFVYRCFDADGQLLYIGCAHDVEERIYKHRTTFSSLTSVTLRLRMDRYEAVEFPDLASARRAERDAIEREQPLLNVHHNRRGAA